MSPVTSLHPLETGRRAGILMHPTSLPGGRIDGDARRFLDFLAAAGCRAWQVLPLGPTGEGRSPYSPLSVFAGDPALLAAGPGPAPGRADIARFSDEERDWLDDYSLFAVIKAREGLRPWWRWVPELRDRQPAAMNRYRRRHRQEVAAVWREQFRFETAWQRLRHDAGQRGILLIGDLPMFPVADSADVWARRQLFKLEPDGRVAVSAGVPPDLFAEDGQCWGNPVFDWQAMQADGFRWWRARVRRELRRFDLLRWDHFRGLAATWEIPAGAGSAREGSWVPVPGRELLEALSRDLGPLPLVAENLGTITADVEELRRDFGLPGMHVLQFAFDGSLDNPHRPENHERNGVAYTGTHDNDTTLGWFRSLDEATRQSVLDLTGGEAADMPWPAIRTVLSSRSALAVVPMQDYLVLGSEHRMNRPGVAEGNWRWRATAAQLTPALSDAIARLVDEAGR